MSRRILHKPTKPGLPNLAKPGLLRRLAAIVYDLFLLTAVLFCATAILLPFNHGEAVTPEHPFYPVYLLYLLTVSFAFYAWFWTHGGQTLGLRAWQLTVLTLDQNPITWNQAALRFLAAILSWAIFGLGFLWILFDKNQHGWHDKLSKTSVFFTPKQPPN